MSRREDELRVRLTAKDDASSTIDKVADKAEALEKEDVSVNLTAEDRATKTIAEVETRLAGLSDEDKAIVLRAQAREFEKTIGAARRDLKNFQDLSDDEVDLRVRVIEENTKALDTIRAKVRDLDGTTATVNVEAKGLDRLDGALSNIPGQAGVAANALRGIGTGAAGAAAGVGAVVTAAVLLGDAVADAAKSAKVLGDLTNTSTENASRLGTVWSSTGADVKDLQDVILQMNGVLADQPELLAQIGAEIARNNDGSVDLARTFANVVEAVRGLPPTMENAALKSRLFGEEGVRQVQALTSRFDDLNAAIAEVPEGLVVSDADARAAAEYEKNVAAITQEAQALGLTLGQTVLPLLTQVSSVLKSLAPLAAALGKGLGALGADLPGFDVGFLDVAPIVGSAQSLADVFGEGVDNVDRLKAGVSAVIPPLKLIPGGFFDVKTEAEKAADEAARLAEKAAEVEPGIDLAGRAAAGFVDSMSEAELAAAKTAAEARETASATERSEAAIRAAATDAERYARAQERATNAFNLRQGGALAAASLRERLRLAQEAQALVEKDTSATVDAKVAAAVETAEAYADVASNAAAANGEEFTMTQRNAALTASLKSSAEAAGKRGQKGLAGAVDEVAEAIDDLPKEVGIEFEGRTANAYSSLRAFERDAESLDVDVPVDANTSRAEAELRDMIRYYESRGLALPARVYFGGESVAPGGSTSGGNRPRTAGASVTIVNLPPGASGREVVAAQRRHARRNGGF
jgi:uncharacterized phage infection (PIP) family protein YhgE